MKRCRVSGKQKYRGKLDVMISNMDRPITARAYRCPHCGLWHLTRRPPAT